jgi:hypothetical protein
MNTTCEKHSESLLLVVHDELRGWPRLKLETHLLLCGECRAKERRLRSLSTTLAISLKNPSLGSRTFHAPKRVLWATLGLGAASMVFLGAQLVGAGFTSQAAFHNSAPHCSTGEGPNAVKLAPPPIPKPVPKSRSAALTRDCIREVP